MPPIPLSGDIRAVRTIWQPAFTCVVRIREAETELWSCVFATPVPACIFTDLKPDTEYELQVRTRTAAGEGEPALLGMRTNSAGTSDNIIPSRNGYAALTGTRGHPISHRLMPTGGAFASILAQGVGDLGAGFARPPRPPRQATAERSLTV